jgi:DNA-binding CsgD family transcriptional regulator
LPTVLTTAGSGLRLFISRHTVSRHIRNLCKKFGAKNSVHLISMFTGVSCFTPHPALTRRENEVVSFLARGVPQKVIAEEMGISVRTVYKHRENILFKLNVHSIRGLERFYTEPGKSKSGNRNNIM